MDWKWKLVRARKPSEGLYGKDGRSVTRRRSCRVAAHDLSSTLMVAGKKPAFAWNRLQSCCMRLLRGFDERLLLTAGRGLSALMCCLVKCVGKQRGSGWDGNWKFTWVDTIIMVWLGRRDQVIEPRGIIGLLCPLDWPVDVV